MAKYTSGGSGVLDPATVERICKQCSKTVEQELKAALDRNAPETAGHTIATLTAAFERDLGADESVMRNVQKAVEICKRALAAAFSELKRTPVTTESQFNGLVARLETALENTHGRFRPWTAELLASWPKSAAEFASGQRKQVQDCINELFQSIARRFFDLLYISTPTSKAKQEL
jgi:hypothetical protein